MSDNQGYSNLAGLARSLLGVRTGIQGMKAQIKELEAREQELIAELLIAMQAENMKSVNLAGIGKLVIKTRKLPKIKDIELLTRAMLGKIIEAGREGRPLSDGLLLQQRLHQSNFEAHFADTDPALSGVEVVEKDDITFTPAKEAK